MKWFKKKNKQLNKLNKTLTNLLMDNGIFKITIIVNKQNKVTINIPNWMTWYDDKTRLNIEFLLKNNGYKYIIKNVANNSKTIIIDLGDKNDL